MKPQVRLIVFAIFLLTFSLQFTAFVIITSVKLGFFGHVATKTELQEIRDATATLVYSEDEVLLGKIFIKNRTKIHFDDLPEHFVSALVATEDARYFRHGGIDYWSMFRVFFKSILMGDKSSGGGSTLTQQLAKNLYGRDDYGAISLPVNKLKEMVIAGRLEDIYSKEQILEIYLNTVPFSENCYGIGEGARRFFGVHPSQLKIEESAVLVGMLKANTYYNPRLNPVNATVRRNTVLFQMNKYGYLTSNELDSLEQLPLKLDYTNLIANSRAPYFMLQVRKEAEAILKDLKKPDGTEYRIEQDGLIIKSTLNAKMQEAAQKALREHLAETQPKFEKHWGELDPWYEHKYVYDGELHRSHLYKNLRDSQLSDDSIDMQLNQKHKMEIYTYHGDTVVDMSPADSVRYYLRMLKGGFFAMQPSGGVKVWVGGVDYQYFPYDHVRSKRQSASTFKPFVYAAALKNGAKPCDYISNERRMYPKYDNWAPANYHDDYEGAYSMKAALKKSINVIAVKTIFKAGIDNTIDLAHQLGIESELPRQPSVALGAGSVSLYEMVQAYGVFASNGYKHQPYMVSEITTGDGEVIYKYKPAEEPKQPLDTITAGVMTEMLRSVVDGGTGNRLRWMYGLKNDLAGKTGTSQDFSDAWFIGFNPNLVAGAWIGGSSPVVRFKTGTYGSGSALALPVFGKFYNYINKEEDLNEYTQAKFSAPSEYVSEILNCPDYHETTIVDKFKDLFKEKEPGTLLEEDEGEGFLDKLFNRDQ